MELIVFAVYINNTVASGINHSKLAPFKEIFCFERINGFQGYCFCHRHHSSENKTVIHGIGQVDLILLHYFRHHEVRAKLLGVILFHIIGMACTHNGV